MKSILKSSDMLRHVPDFRYKIVHSRRRTMSIIVSPDKGVLVKAPLRTPVSVIDNFVGEKAEWIIKTLKSFSSLVNLSDLACANGERLLYEGKEHLLRVLESDKYYVRLVNGSEIEVGTAGRKDPEVVHSLLEAWFKLIARKKLSDRFINILSRYKSCGLMPSSFSVARMKKRWGSCSSKGRIAISYDLIRLDPVFSEYVIIHELCHLKYHNHSSDYYRFLTELYPEWRQVREKLRKYIRFQTPAS